MTAIERAIENWRAAGIELLPGVDEAVVIETMKQSCRPVSRDVIDLYKQVGGFKEDGVSDSRMWSFWSLQQVRDVKDRYKDHKSTSTFFADWSINAHFHCFRYESTDFSSVYVDALGNSKPLKVADSITKFFELYLTSPRSLYI